MSLPLSIKKTGERLITVDALRGIAALGITISHAAGNLPYTFETLQNSWLSLAFYPFSANIGRVYLFFLISGFSIHLSWCKNKIKTGANKNIEFIPFWKKRLIRLYPTYLIALSIYLIGEFVVGKLIFNQLFVWDFVSHLLMIHNADARTVYSINGSFWTLAVEEQLYLAYFFFIWLRIRYGWKIVIPVALGIRLGWFLSTPFLSSAVGWKIPAVESSFGTWCIWILGALSIEYAFGVTKLPKIFSSFKVGIILVLLTSLWYGYGLSNETSGVLKTLWWISAQPLWGFSFFFIINGFVALENRTLPDWSTSLLKVFAKFGTFAYSLYLVNDMMFAVFGEFHWTIKALAAVMFAYVFHLLFEKPFIDMAKQKKSVSIRNLTESLNN
jgi:peptidoglycan/LPS O-acetylase OafA/YrhL